LALSVVHPTFPLPALPREGEGVAPSPEVFAVPEPIDRAHSLVTGYARQVLLDLQHAGQPRAETALASEGGWAVLVSLRTHTWFSFLTETANPDDLLGAAAWLTSLCAAGGRRSCATGTGG
jgi:hypothetical protein